MSPRRTDDGITRAVKAVLASATGATEGGRDDQPREDTPISGVLTRGLPEPKVRLDDSGMELDDELGLTMAAGLWMRRGHLKVGDPVLVVPVGGSRFVLVDGLLFGAERSRGGPNLSIEYADRAATAGSIGGGGPPTTP